MSSRYPVLERVRLFRHCPRCGAAGMQVRGHNLTLCASCDLHLYHNPCAAAVAILVDDNNQVLLARRAKEPARGKLSFPGGYVDDNESFESAVAREVREEVGLETGALHYLTSHPNIYSYCGVVYPVIDAFYLARVPDFSAARALDEVAELVVLPIADLREEALAFDSMRVAWRVFRSHNAALS